MEVYGVAEALFVPKTTTADLDHLDSAIDTLSATVVGSQQHGIEDTPEMGLDSLGDLLHRRQSTPHRPP